MRGGTCALSEGELDKLVFCYQGQAEAPTFLLVLNSFAAIVNSCPDRATTTISVQHAVRDRTPSQSSPHSQLGVNAAGMSPSIELVRVSDRILTSSVLLLGNGNGSGSGTTCGLLGEAQKANFFQWQPNLLGSANFEPVVRALDVGGRFGTLRTCLARRWPARNSFRPRDAGEEALEIWQWMDSQSKFKARRCPVRVASGLWMPALLAKRRWKSSRWARPPTFGRRRTSEEALEVWRWMIATPSRHGGPVDFG